MAGCHHASLLILLVSLAALGTQPSSADEQPADARQTEKSGGGQSRSEAGVYTEIRVLDAATRRGVPLAELETVNGLTFVTDNAGRAAFDEPGLMDREIYFSVRSHGYAAKKDGFGFAGVRLTPRAGKVAVIEVERINLAERMCRLTGEGLYRDTRLLGYTPPLPDSLHPGNVGGQDSVQAAIHRGKVFWFWGDTQRMDYPLGLFRTAGATSPIFDPSDAKSDPAAGMAFEYFVDKQSGFARAMMPLPERPEGVIWISGVAAVPDGDGERAGDNKGGGEKLVAHYSRRKGLADEYEQGIAVFDDEKSVFTSAKQLPLEETWRRPSGHPILFEEQGTKWLLYGSPTPNVRVRATLNDVLDAERYEAFTCLKRASDGRPAEPDLDADGRPAWRWQKELPPLSSQAERELVTMGKIGAKHARFYPADASQPGDRVVLHSGSVRWNEYRKCWVMLAGQIGGQSSLLGEVWYAEASHPTGPFPKAVRVVTHDRQSFYNVCHHGFLDRDGGRVIHFEGTYTNDFSGNPLKTPRFNYNQILYRLDLSSPALRAAR